MDSGRRGDLVLASHRNNLSICGARIGRDAQGKVRDWEDAFAKRRDARAILPARARAQRPRALEQVLVRNRSFLQLPRDQLRGIRHRY